MKDKIELNEEENQEMYQSDFFEEEEYDSDGILTGEQYEIPDDADAFIDTGEGEVIKKEDMTSWEIIKAIAKQNNVVIQNPSKGCKHCYGRGYDGTDSQTKMPIPCRCLFRGRKDSDKEAESLYDSSKLNKRFSREQRRKMAKFLKKQKKSGLLTPNEGEKRKELSNYKINKILKEYIKKESLKKTASSLNLSLSCVKRTVKENRDKIEKLKENK